MFTLPRPPSQVTTDWVAQHYADPDVMVIEVGTDASAYAEGHVPGALLWEWPNRLLDVTRQGEVITARLEALLGCSGIDNYTTVLLYGDPGSAAVLDVFRLLQAFGHQDLKLMEGGRAKWIAEDRPLTTAVPSPIQKPYRANEHRRPLAQD